MISNIRFFNIKLILNLLLFITLCLFLVSVFSPSKTSALSGSQFNAANIIDDSVFFNKHTMTDHQIQAFLNSKVPACDTWHAQSGSANDPGPPYKCLRDYTQAVPTVAGNSYCAAIGGNGTVYSAAQIISIVSHYCDINPQSLIVLLQKEQSLITDTWPWPIQYRSATGYGCPDTAPCDAEFYGYFNQVYKAAWQFKKYAQNPNNYAHRAGQNNTVYFHPGPCKTQNSAGNCVEWHPITYCGSTNLYIQNQATAGLYNYTPYQPNQAALNNLYGTGDGCSSYGNRNFWRMFNDWFGSTNGDLVRTVNNATVYLIIDDKKHPISSMNVLSDFSILGPVRYVSDSFVNSLSTGNTLGSMVQGPNLTLYFVNAGIKMPFTDCNGDVIDYGYTCASGQFTPLSEGQINKLANGPRVTKLIKSNTNGTIYYMENGKKRSIPSWNDLEKIKIPIVINVLTNPMVSQYPNGPLLVGPGNLVKTASNGTVYVVRDLNYLYPITSFIFPVELGLNTGVRTISNSDFQTYTVSNVTLKNMVKCGSNNYIGTAGKNYSVSGPTMTTYGFSPDSFLSGGTGLCNNLSVSPTALGRYILSSKGTIYYVNNSGQKQAFTSYNSYVSHQAGNGNPGYINVSEFFANNIPNGTNL